MKRILTSRQAVLWVLFAVVMLLLPQVVSSGTLRIIIFANFLAIFAMSWDFLSGKTGYVSFGHPFLIGIGAYTTAILAYRFDVPVGISIPVAVLVDDRRRHAVFPAGAAHQGYLFCSGDAGLHGADVPAHPGDPAGPDRRHARHVRHHDDPVGRGNRTSISPSFSCS